MWDRLKLVTPGAAAVSLAEAKAHLNVTHSDDDTLIMANVAAAQAAIEGPNGIGVALTSHTWRISLDCWPAMIAIPLGPVLGVTSITYIDTAGVTQTLDADDYKVDLDHSPARIAPAYGVCWPAVRREIGAIKVTFTAGHASVPADLKAALLLIVGQLYADRGDGEIELPPAADRILNRYRVGVVG